MNASVIIQIFITGIIILVGAIIVNGIAKAIGLLTWYDFIGVWSEKGFVPALIDAGWISALFLFVLYPFMLGLFGYVGIRIMA